MHQVNIRGQHCHIMISQKTIGVSQRTNHSQQSKYINCNLSNSTTDSQQVINYLMNTRYTEFLNKKDDAM